MTTRTITFPDGVQMDLDGSRSENKKMWSLIIKHFDRYDLQWELEISLAIAQLKEPEPIIKQLLKEDSSKKNQHIPYSFAAQAISCGTEVSVETRHQVIDRGFELVDTLPSVSADFSKITGGLIWVSLSHFPVDDYLKKKCRQLLANEKSLPTARIGAAKLLEEYDTLAKFVREWRNTYLRRDALKVLQEAGKINHIKSTLQAPILDLHFQIEICHSLMELRETDFVGRYLRETVRKIPNVSSPEIKEILSLLAEIKDTETLEFVGKANKFLPENRRQAAKILIDLGEREIAGEIYLQMVQETEHSILTPREEINQLGNLGRIDDLVATALKGKKLPEREGFLKDVFEKMTNGYTESAFVAVENLYKLKALSELQSLSDNPDLHPLVIEKAKKYVEMLESK